jgi:hypothetical protein
MAATHVTERSMTRRAHGLGQKLFTDNFFSSPDLFDDLHTTVVGMSDKTTRECQGALTVRY